MISATGINTSSEPWRTCALVGATVVLRHADRRPEEHRLLDAFLSAQQALLSEESAKAADAALVPLVETVARELQAAATARVVEAGDPVQRTYILWAALHGLDHFRKRDRILPPNLRVGALVPATLGALARGWGATERHASAAVDLLVEFEATTSAAESQSRAKQ